MEKRKRILAVTLLVIVVLFLAALPKAIKSQQRRMIVGKRMQDVKTLVGLYLESYSGWNTDNVTNTRNLMSLLEQRRIKLHNPIPKNPLEPCYRVAFGEADPEILIVETTNVADDDLIVRGYTDGHVAVDRKKAAQ